MESLDESNNQLILKGMFYHVPMLQQKLEKQWWNTSWPTRKKNWRGEKDEVAEHIRVSQEQYGSDDDVDNEEYADFEGITVASDDTDLELTMAIQASLRDRKEWEEK